MGNLLKVGVAILALGVLLVGALIGLVAQIGGAGQTAGDGFCQAPLPTFAPATGASANLASAGLAMSADLATHPTVTPTQTGVFSPIPEGDNPCFSRSRYGAQIVWWAKRMADALTVDPACGTSRTPPHCDRYVYYTAAFPSAVSQYGRAWCHTHGGCDEWDSGDYQCVSFVRGAYSQVYPMNLTADAFDLWYVYQHQPGWQEIPAAAGDVAERGLPEPGDVMVFRDDGLGHVAIVTAVIAPHDGKNGEVAFANANSTSPYDRMPLLPSLLVDTSSWIDDPSTIVWGYLRPKTDASSSVARISQLDPAQYASTSEFTTWAYSACSTAAMTEVLNAYGGTYRIHDVLAVESTLTIPGSAPPEPYITPQLGLTSEAGIAATMQQFNFTTTWSDHWALLQVLAAANNGTPVIVSWPPDRYAGGHLVVVLGGDSRSVRIADSSRWNRHILTTAQFLQWWGGFAAIATPAFWGTPTVSGS